MKTAIAIQHLAFEDLGSLEPHLRDRGYAIECVSATSDRLQQLDPHAPTLAVVLGGPIGAYDDAAYPFLRNEADWIARRLSAGLPTLGICLGAQLMARALEARTYPGHCKEMGWSPIELSAAGWQSPLRHLAQTAVLHWHGDTYDLPAGATRLASNALYANQAFAWGEWGLALQFHPEVTAPGLERWFVGHAHEIGATAGTSVVQLRQETAHYSPTLERQAHALWDEWLSAVDSVAKEGT